MPVGPDIKLINTAFRIKPVFTDRDGHRWLTEPFDLYEKLYGRDPLDAPAAVAEADDLTKLCDIEIRMPATLWGGEVGGPTIAQVLPQIPKEWIDKAVAFEAHMADSRDGDNGYVTGRVELYGGTLPDAVKTQPVVAWKKTYDAPLTEPPPPKPAFDVAAATRLEEPVTMRRFTFKPGTGIKSP
jgi:hypothetical protein